MLPVRYSVAGDRILFWADPHDHPAAIADNTVIGFQADDIDAVTHEGWSVMVVGLATHVKGDESVAALEEGPPRGLGSGERATRRVVARPRQRAPALECRAARGRTMSSEHDIALVELARDECLLLLGVFTVGRVAIALPSGSVLVVPVNYVLDGEAIVFRSDPGEKLDQLHGTPVSFQIDFIDPVHHTGWSVLVQGTGHRGARPKSNTSTSNRGRAARSPTGCAWCPGRSPGGAWSRPTSRSI